jgi:4-aminobutyrate aminotransferase-like enzyme
MSESLPERRARLLGRDVPTFYRAPVHIVRGEGVWLWDAEGRRYLDAYNNVPHVGHGHPRVVEAMCRQAAALNVHSRYLHEGILDYAERLAATFGHGPTQTLFACTGSEAMDAALRMAEAATGRTGIVATDNTYHGNTRAVAQLSTRRPPIGGYPSHVRLIPAPDELRPVGGDAEGQAGAFAGHLARAVAELEEAGHGLAAFVLCPVFANEGLPGLAPGWLDDAARVARQAGGLVIADEVQPGLGRLGSHWWGHQLMGLAPDIAVLGKSLGNGYPLAAAVTRPDIMDAFRGAFGYFNTFAATPVAAAAGSAVLDVIEAEGLMENAARVSSHLAARLEALAEPGLVRVTARGLMLAVELAEADGLTPDGARAAEVVEDMRRAGVLIGRIGRHGQVLKIRPPLPFAIEHADRTADALAAALSRTRADVPA